MNISSVKPGKVQNMVKRACGESGEMPAETLSAYFEIKKLVHVYEIKDITVEDGDMECIVLPFVKAMSDMFPAIFVMIMQDNASPLASSLEAVQRMYQLSSYHYDFTSEELVESRVYVGIYNEENQKLRSVETAIELVQKSQKRRALQEAKEKQAKQSARIVQPAKPSQSARTAQSVRAAQAAKPTRAAKPVQPAKPTQAARAAQTAKSAQTPDRVVNPK